MTVVLDYVQFCQSRNNKGGTTTCFAIRKPKGQRMNKGAIALALRFVGYLSGYYGLDSVGADAQWP
jgi:hypothetical protein